MRKAFFLPAILIVTICHLGRATDYLRTPLQAVPSNSVMLDDFFWYYYQQETNQATSTQSTLYNWQVNKQSPNNLKKRIAKWEQRYQTADILGKYRDAQSHLTNAQDDLADALHIFRESYELAQLTGDAKFFDFAERVLYNRILAQWRTSSDKKATQQAAALLQQCGSMAFSTSGKDVYINMLMRNNAHIVSPDVDFFLQSVNSSPWYYQTSFTIIKDNADLVVKNVEKLSRYTTLVHHDSTNVDSMDINFHIRIPSWATGQNILPSFSTKVKKTLLNILVNGRLATPEIKNGYALVSGRWAVHDIITINFAAPILRLQDMHRPDMVALQRGPMVYCFESNPSSASLNTLSPISHKFSKPDSCVVLSGEWLIGNHQESFRALPYFMCNDSSKIFVRKNHTLAH